MSHAHRSDDVVHMLYGKAGMEDPVAKRKPPVVRLSKRQKEALKGLPKPGWFVRNYLFLNALSGWVEYEELRDAGYVVEQINLFDHEPDIGITGRGLRAIQRKKKAINQPMK